MNRVAVEHNALLALAPPGLRDLYRILLLRKNGSEFLVGDDDPPLTLPCVEIPRWERVAENVTTALKKRYGISAVCLFTPDLPAITTDREQPLYQVMETRGADCTTPEDMRWLSVDSFSDRSFEDRNDAVAIASAWDRIREFQSEAIEPFAKPGWIEELFSWVQHEIGRFGLRLSGELRQLNASPTFALLRLGTNGPAVWFKAVGEPNLREFPISATLANLFPCFVPAVIATHPTWNGWLATEFAGSTLDGVLDAHAWERAAETLARLQIASVGLSNQLLKAECRDLRIISLLPLIDPFMEVMSHLMEQQSRATPPVLNAKELRTLGRQIEDALSDLADLNIPDTLGHLDFNPGNILCSSDQCVFIDWAEAYVGPPFLTFQYLLEHLRQTPMQRVIESQSLVGHYVGSWLRRMPPSTVAAAERIAPLLAVFACAVASDWAEIPHSMDASSAAYLRSMTRRMQLEAGVLLTSRTHSRVRVPG